MSENKPKLLSLYTNLVALEGILFGQGIRLCCTNEMKHFILMLEKAVLKRCEIESRQDLVSMVKTIFSEEIDECKNDTVYLVSFTEWEDDAAQWERYGNSGYGI